MRTIVNKRVLPLVLAFLILFSLPILSLADNQIQITIDTAAESVITESSATIPIIINAEQNELDTSNWLCFFKCGAGFEDEENVFVTIEDLTADGDGIYSAKVTGEGLSAGTAYYLLIVDYNPDTEEANLLSNTYRFETNGNEYNFIQWGDNQNEQNQTVQVIFYSKGRIDVAPAGRDDMRDWNSPSSSPWCADYNAYYVTAKSIDVKDGIHHIGNYTFSPMPNLTTVTTGYLDPLTSIGEYAFKDCTSLRDVYLYANAEDMDIASTAFDGCSDVTIHVRKGQLDAYQAKFADLPNVTFDSFRLVTLANEDIAFTPVCDSADVAVTFRSEDGGMNHFTVNNNAVKASDFVVKDAEGNPLEIVPTITQGAKDSNYSTVNVSIAGLTPETDYTLSVNSIAATANNNDYYFNVPVERAFTTTAHNWEDGECTLCHLRDISFATIADIDDQAYVDRDTAVTPEPVVTFAEDEPALVKDTDYTVTYDKNVLCGEATVTITGIGNYTGTKSATFNIVLTDEALNNEIDDLRDESIANIAVLANLVDKDKYTPDSYKDYMDAYTAFKDLVLQQNTQDSLTDIRAARKAVTQAYMKLVERTDIKDAEVTLAKTSVAYTGKAQTPAETVVIGDKTLVKGTDYTVSYKNNKNAGTATVTITGIGDYKGTVSKTFKITKIANPMTVKVKKATNNVSLSKVTKAAQTVACPVTVSKAQGTVTYAKASGSSANVTVDSKTGKLTVKKGTKKGTYTVKIKVTAKGNTNYNSATSKVLTVKIVVK